MGGPLDGLEVLELSTGAAASIVGMLLSDQGARVTRIESPRGKLTSRDSGYRVWNRGKRSAFLDLDLDVDQGRVRALAQRADVVIESHGWRITEARRLDYATLSAINPGLVYCSISAYPIGSPDDGRSDDEALVAARSGMQWAQRGGIMSGGHIPAPDVEIPEGALRRGRHDGPAFVRSPWMSLGAAYHALMGINAALLVRETTGRGQHVRTSMARPSDALPSTNDAGGAIVGNWMMYEGAPKGLFECGDGRWIHHWALRPLPVLAAAEHGNLAEAPAPSSESSRHDPDRIGLEPQAIVEVFYYFTQLREAFLKFPSEEWVRWGLRTKVPIYLVQTPEEALADPLLLEDGCVVEVEDPEVGPIRHVGIVKDFGTTPGRVNGAAPRPGEQTAEVIAEADALGESTAPWPQEAALGEPIAGPLAGVTVIDIGLALAGPFGAAQLAKMGANVIKVSAPWDGWWFRAGIAELGEAGKRCIAINLQEERGLDLLKRLAARADVVMHNMRDGVVERLGADYESLREVNPSLVYLHSRGFDRTRAAMRLMGTDQSASALSGQEWEDGGCADGGDPLFGTSMGDTGCGYLAASAAMEALYHRARTGEGQKVGTAILNACLVTCSYAYAQGDGSEVERQRLDANQLGLGALYRIYETTNGWFCIAAHEDEHWHLLCEGLELPELASDPRFGSAELRGRHRRELSELLEPVFAKESNEHWIARLDALGVPCEISAESTGAYNQAAHYIDFSDTPEPPKQPAPTLGEHTHEILDWLGCDAAEIASLLADGIVADSDGIEDGS